MSMVVCCKCKTVVWAYDHETRPISSIMNSMNMVCPNCGGVRTFDGWDGDRSWAEMHKIADDFGYKWQPDGSCRWFGDMTATIANLLRLSPRTCEILHRMFEELEKQAVEEGAL